mgnify:CR=1 FL=1
MSQHVNAPTTVATVVVTCLFGDNPRDTGGRPQA